MRRTLTIVALLGLGWAARGAPPPPSPNIVVISIDGLRADRCHFDGNPRNTTPSLDALAADGVRFTHAFSQSNESLLSHAALLTGRYPSEIGPVDTFAFTLREDLVTLPEALGSIGYDTAAFVAGGHLREELGLAQGFDSWNQADDFGSFFQTVPAALSWLSGRQGDSATTPFFVLLHGYDVHRPYAHESVFYHPFDADYEGPMDALVDQRNATERIYRGTYYPDLEWTQGIHSSGLKLSDPSLYLRLAAGEGGAGQPLTPEDLDHMVAHYDSGVLAADTWVGIFLDTLRSRGLWENTVILVVSDHGEDLQTHGFSNHRPVVYDSTTRVPFLIGGGAMTNEWRGSVRDELVDALDLPATVMTLAGSVAPAGHRGRDALAGLRGIAQRPEKQVVQQGVLGQTAIRTRTHRLIFQGHHPADPGYAGALESLPITSGAFKLMNLARDPLEQHDRLEGTPTVEDLKLAEDLREELVTWSKTLESPETNPRPPSDALRTLLAEHGYW